MTVAQSAMLQSLDFNLRVEHALKVLYYISKTDLVTLQKRIQEQSEAECMCEIEKKKTGVEFFQS